MSKKSKKQLAQYLKALLEAETVKDKSKKLCTTVVKENEGKSK